MINSYLFQIESYNFVSHPKKGSKIVLNIFNTLINILEPDKKVSKAYVSEVIQLDLEKFINFAMLSDAPLLIDGVIKIIGYLVSGDNEDV